MMVTLTRPDLSLGSLPLLDDLKTMPQKQAFAKLRGALQSPPSDDEVEEDDISPGNYGHGTVPVEYGELFGKQRVISPSQTIACDDQAHISRARLPTPPSSNDEQTRSGANLTSSTTSSDLPPFSFGNVTLNTGFAFSSQPVYPAGQGTKRGRHLLDVDGSHTAGLSYKKRRIRADLITSRLSQAYSQPATHILNREGMKCGDKRFLKFASSVDAAKRRAQVHATSVLRFSFVNRLRKRFGLTRPTSDGPSPGQALSRGETAQDSRLKSWPDGGSLRKPFWKPQSLLVTSDGKYPRANVSDASPTRSSRNPVHHAYTPRSCGGQAFPGLTASTPSKSRLSSQVDQQPSPIAQSTSPIPPSLPDFGLNEADQDPDDDDSHTYRYLYDDHEDDDVNGRNNDMENVYCDFGTMFGAGVPQDSHASSEHSNYEEYLDELDGISWLAK